MTQQEGPASAGVGVDLAVHDLDLIAWLLPDDRTVRVFGEIYHGGPGPGEDALHGVITLAGGAVWTVDASRVAPVNERSITVTTGSARFDCDLLEQTLACHSAEGSRDAAHPADADRPVRSAHQDHPRRGDAITPTDALRAEISDFADAARRAVKPRSDAADGLAAVRLADALLSSAAAGVPVELDAED